MTSHTAFLPTDPILSIESPGMQYKPTEPVACKVLVNERITPADYSEDVRHLVLDLSHLRYDYVEGQSVGILAPGIGENGKPHKVRLYSIASPAIGEPGYGQSMALTIKRVVYEHHESLVRGICSNYLCDLHIGDTVMISGPSGKNFNLPSDQTTDLILFATGTGIAPYRSFLMNLSSRPNRYEGDIHLFFGSRKLIDQLYDTELNDDLRRYSQGLKLHIHAALSREIPGQKMYVTDILQKEKEAIESVLSRRNFAVYICGLKGMEKGIEAFVRSYLEHQSGQTINDTEWFHSKHSLRKLGRWSQEVY